MNPISRTDALEAAIDAARAAGAIMRKNLISTHKRINEATQHDIKLELDVRCQKLIERRLSKTDRTVAILGEEGVSGDPKAPQRWVIDPIDGTVNFTYGIPHACVSIALDERIDISTRFGPAYQTVAGVVYDPFCDELWTAIRGEPARLNGKKIHVSQRTRLDESIVSLGFAKKRSTLNKMLPNFVHLVPRVRKIRIMGAAALAMVYVASGRLDAYMEYGVRWWDIAAGGLILEMAGGDFQREQISADLTHRVLANNGPVGHLLRRYY